MLTFSVEMQLPFAVNVFLVPFSRDREFVETLRFLVWMKRSTCARRLGDSGARFGYVRVRGTARVNRLARYYTCEYPKDLVDFAGC